MVRRTLLGITVAALAMITLAALQVPSFAAVCSPPGEVVVTDPPGDGPAPEVDILDIAIQEVVAGLHAGKIIVTMHVSSLAGTPSGLWAVEWRDGTGNNITRLAMNACEGDASFTFEYTTPEGTDSGTPDGGSYTTGGAIEWILSRDKIGDPADGETFQQIQGIAILWVPLDPLPGCLPQSGNDGAGPGQYTVGSCLVDAPSAAPAVALRLGAPAPNPARGDVSFALDVPAMMAGRDHEVAMFDMAGRRVRTLASGLTSAGRTPLRWDLRNARGERVRPGTYWARITVAGERRAQAVVVVH
jgi:hypothetical protein